MQDDGLCEALKIATRNYIDKNLDHLKSCRPKSHEYNAILRLIIALQDGLFIVKESEAILERLRSMEVEGNMPPTSSGCRVK